MNPHCQLSEEEIVELRAADISKDHAKNGRFNGKHMSMGVKSQSKVIEVVSKRLDLSNIDRVATGSSSNRCENMFSKLSKWTHGKRNYQGRTDSWECNELYVAMMINNDDADKIEDKIREITGVTYLPSLREDAVAAATKCFVQKTKDPGLGLGAPSILPRLASNDRSPFNPVRPK
jgi:hypothetical protein